MQVERRFLRRFDDVADRNFGWRTTETVSAVRAARAAHDAGATQPKKNLLDIVAGKLLNRGDLAPGDRTFSEPAREMQSTDDAVLGERSYAHR